MTAPPGIVLGPSESLMRRHNAAIKLLRYHATTPEERLALLLAVVAPSEEMVEAIEAFDADEGQSS